MALFISIIGLVAANVNRNNMQAGSTNSQSTILSIQKKNNTSSNDEALEINSGDISTATVTADFAQKTNLAVANDASNLHASMSAQKEFSKSSSNSSSSSAKPLVIDAKVTTNKIIEYTAKSGDTVPEIAKKFNISAQTIKWSNNMESDAVEVDRKLIILPVDGIVITPGDEDTIDSIANKYKANRDRIIALNDLEVETDVIKDKKLIVPEGVLPEQDRPGYVPPRRPDPRAQQRNNYSSTNSRYVNNNLGASVGNRYAFGNCTWYAYERRARLGRPIGSFWGNASTWAMNARASGYIVNNTPAPGAVMQNGGGWGHVAIVESVNSDGSVNVSDMNYGGGFNRITHRTVSAGAAGGYQYIH